MNQNIDFKKKAYKSIVTSIISATLLSGVIPMKASGEELGSNETEDKDLEVSLLDILGTQLPEEHLESVNALIEMENNNINGLFEEAVLNHYNQEFNNSIELYNMLLVNEGLPEDTIKLIEWLIIQAEDQSEWKNHILKEDEENDVESVVNELDTIEQDNQEIEETKSNENTHNSTNEESNLEDNTYNAGNDELSEKDDSADTSKEKSQVEEYIENSEEELNKEADEAKTDKDQKLDDSAEKSKKETSVYTSSNKARVNITLSADEIYNNVLSGQNASDAWTSANELKKHFPSDSRLVSAINNAAERILSLGQSNHRNRNYSRAIDYYNELLNESLVDKNIVKTAEYLNERASEQRGIEYAATYYNNTINASTASNAWNNAQILKSVYPNDHRKLMALESAANRIFAMGRSSHRKQDYNNARYYYNLLLDEPLLSQDWRNEAKMFYDESLKDEKRITADELYNNVTGAKTATDAWNAAQTFKENYPKDNRISDAIDSAAQRIYAMGTSNHKKGNHTTADIYYSQILSESLISPQLRNRTVKLSTLASKGRRFLSANDYYKNTLNAKTATDAWNTAQEYIDMYPQDSRVNSAVNNAAQRILAMGTSNHRRGKYSNAITYYSQLISEEFISSALKSEVSDLNSLAKKGVKLRSVTDYYNDSLRASTATDAWNSANEGLNRYPGETKLVDALNTAAMRQFSMGQSLHRKGNYSLALTYYNRIFNHKEIDSELNQVVNIFRKKALQSKPLMTASNYRDSSLKASTASSAWNTALEGLTAYPNNDAIESALDKAANRNLSLGRSQFKKGNFSSARTYFDRVYSEVRVSESIRTLAGVFAQQLAPNYKYTVYIDPGHGGKDPGASFGGVDEADLNLSTSLFLRKELEARGYNVVMSRDTDVFLELSDRPFEANEISADVFVGIHYNSMGGAGTARGIETFIYHRVASGFGQETNRNNFIVEDPRIDESLRLADAIHGNLIKRTTMRDRGVKGNNFNVLRNSHIPAMLTELGFLDNAADRNISNTRQYQLTAARAMADGIDSYFGN